MILPNTVRLSVEDASHFLANLLDKEPSAVVLANPTGLRYLVEQAYNQPGAYDTPSSNKVEEAKKIIEECLC